MPAVVACTIADRSPGSDGGATRGSNDRTAPLPSDAGGGPYTKYLTFNTPVGKPAAEQCGRTVFTDLHVSNNDDGKVFPEGCKNKELTVAERVIEFLLYDLSACVQDDKSTRARRTNARTSNLSTTCSEPAGVRGRGPSHDVPSSLGRSRAR